MKPVLLSRVTVVVFIAATALVFASPSFSSVFHIRPDGSGDYPTIRDAVLAAVDGDSVVLENGWFSGPDNHNIDFQGRRLAVVSASGDPTLSVIYCGVENPFEDRGFKFQSGEDAGAVIDGIGITNGYTHGPYCDTNGAGIMCLNGSSPTIRNCYFKFCDAVAGGAVGASFSSPTFYNCRFVQNVSTSSGGAVYVNGASARPQFIGCRFLQNTAGYDGGAVVIMSGQPLFRNCEFDANVATNYGGAVYANAGPSLFQGCAFRNHVAAYQGGVVLSEFDASPRFESCTLTGNSGVWGGISYIRGHQTWFGCTLVGNGSDHGALFAPAEGGSITADHTVIAFSTRGSAVFCMYGTAVVQCSDIYANPGGDWLSCIEDQYDGFNNLSVEPGFCNPEEGDFHLRPDSPLLEGNNPCGRIGAWGPGCESASAPDERTGARPILLRAAPNPAPSGCRIEWSGLVGQPASIELFDVSGRLVRSIPGLPPGVTAVSWNGRSDTGNPVPSGIYLARVRDASGAEIGSTRIVLTR